MIRSSRDLIDSSLSFSPIQENSVPSKVDETCKKVMGVLLIVFGIASVCAFTACLSAAIILGSAPLAMGAAAVAFLGIGILITSAIAYRNKPEEYLVKEDVAVVDQVEIEANPCVDVVYVNNEQNQRRSVPQHCLSKRSSNLRMQVNIPRSRSDLSRAVHVLPGSRDIRQGHVQVGSRL